MIKFDLPKNQSSMIKVMGVGGGGSNAVSHMYNQGIRGVDFILCNTDIQAMEASPVPTKIQLGSKGLGAGSIPSVGKESALEKTEEIKEILEKNTQMLFITAGMGGGTGTGAAPVIAEIARELDILTVGIVTLPFSFEGRKRRLQAEEGIEELKKNVDTLLVIVNDKLRMLHGDLKLSQAFQQADDVLTTAAKGIAEIITVTGYINVDFEDVKTVMKNSGKAIMGSGMAEGEERAMKAVEMALSSPLLNDNNIAGASNILLYITSGSDEISMDEVIQITDYIQNEAGANADIIWGNGIEEEIENKIAITIIATGFDSVHTKEPQAKKIYDLDKDNINKEESSEKTTDSQKDKIELKTKTEEEFKPVVKKEKESKTVESEEKEPKKEEKTEHTVVFDLTSGEKTSGDNTRRNLQRKETPVNSSEDSESDELELFNNEESQVIEETEQVEQEKKAQDRIQKLKELSIKLRSPGGLSELESEPAYVRKKLKFSETPSSSESQVSKFTLSEDKNKETKIKTNNKYLHDKAD